MRYEEEEGVFANRAYFGDCLKQLAYFIGVIVITLLNPSIAALQIHVNRIRHE